MSTTDQDAAVPMTSATGRADRPRAIESLGTTIADTATAVDGVHHLGTAAGRVIAGVRTVAAGRQVAPGVRIDQLTGGVQVDVVAEYPVNVIGLADRVRSVVAAVPGVDGARVDVLVIDVHGPFDRDEPEVDPLADADADADGPEAGAAVIADTADAAADAAADAVVVVSEAERPSVDGGRSEGGRP